MKTLLAIFSIFALSSALMANELHPRHPRHPRHGHKKMMVAVKGAKAKAIYNALNTDVITKNGQKFSRDIKKVATLRCVKATKKADTTVVKYRCMMAGKRFAPKRKHPRRKL